MISRRTPYLMASVLAMVFAIVPLAAHSQSCFGQWDPVDVHYQAPASSAGNALLSFGPPTCNFVLDTETLPPEIDVVGSAISVRTVLVDLTGIGVPPPAHRIEVPIAPLPAGSYQLHARFEMWLSAGGIRVVDVDFPLEVTQGPVLTALPIDSPMLLIGLSAMLLLIGRWYLRR